jgi:hypothetical protein
MMNSLIDGLLSDLQAIEDSKVSLLTVTESSPAFDYRRICQSDFVRI